MLKYPHKKKYYYLQHAICATVFTASKTTQSRATLLHDLYDKNTHTKKSSLFDAKINTLLTPSNTLLTSCRRSQTVDFKKDSRNLHLNLF